MAGKSAVLNIKIVSDAKGAAAGFDQAESRVARFERGLDRASVASGVMLAGLGALAVKAFDAASALQQSAGAVESVFGDASREVQAFARDAAQAVGLAESEYNTLAASLGGQLQRMGVPMDDIADKTNELVVLGADLAATYGGTTSEAVQALGSLFRGERDPIERYNVGINQAAINAHLAAAGLDDLEGAARTQAEAQATLALLYDQTAAAQGGFIRETDTAAHAQQVANAEFQNAAAALGEALLPFVTALATELAELAQWVAANTDVVIPLVAVVGGLAATVLLVNAAFSTYRAILVAITAAQWLWNIALTANPIGLIVVAIAAVIAIVVWAYHEFEVVRTVVNTVVNAVVGYIGIWIDAIQWVWDIIQGLGGVFASVFGWIMNVIQPVVDVISWIADKLSWIGDAASWVGDLFSAPMTVQVAGTTGGMMGAAAGMRGAPLMAGAGGGVVGSSSGAGSAGPGMVVNVTVNGALDPVAVGRQIEKTLRDYGRATGRQVALAGRA